MCVGSWGESDPRQLEWDTTQFSDWMFTCTLKDAVTFERLSHVVKTDQTKTRLMYWCKWTNGFMINTNLTFSSTNLRKHHTHINLNMYLYQPKIHTQ